MTTFALLHVADGPSDVTEVHELFRSVKAHTRSLAAADSSAAVTAALSVPAAAPSGPTQTGLIAPTTAVQLAPVANQSADARAAIIAMIGLHGQGLVPFAPGQRQVLVTALAATVTASTNMALTSMELLSISEFVPNNTTSSPALSRRLLVTHTVSGELDCHLHCAYVCAQLSCHAHWLQPPLEESRCLLLQTFSVKCLLLILSYTLLLFILH